MKDNRALGLAIMFFILAVGLALVLWPDVSWAAKIAFFLFGFASGVLAGQYIAGRRSG